MTLFRTPLVLGAAGAALLLGACATPSPERTGAAGQATPAVAAASTAPAAAATPAAPAATSESAVASVDLASTRNAAADALAGKAQPFVYFDFDSAVVRSEFNESIDAHARQLLAITDKRLRIEGHTDERGGREYNLALGQKRAEAVVRSLVLLGVGERQLEAVSFGEERPAAQGSDESAWARNRRAEIKDR